MTAPESSYRSILKNFSIIGSSSLVNIIISLFRGKIVAILLGPSGTGVIGLYLGMISAATTLAALGTDAIGTRQISEAISKNNERTLAIVRSAMVRGTLLLACTSGLIIWTLRDLIAFRMLGSPEHASNVGWLALCVTLSVASASQGALLQGMRRIGDMARLNIYGSLTNTFFGTALLWQMGQEGLIYFILIGPLVNFIFGHWYVSTLPKIISNDISTTEIIQQWGTFLHLGLPFMGTALVNHLTLLWIRLEVEKNLGSESLGQFQAAWSISINYIGFILSAMVADYYPRLTGIINDHKKAAALVNEQTEIALLITAPIFILIIGLSDWIIPLLYTEAFSPATEVLRWQILGDVLKVASWPLAYVLVSLGLSKTFFFLESLTLIFISGLIVELTAIIGLKITGIAFLAGYAIYLPSVYLLAKKNIDFQWEKSILILLAVTFALCAFTATLISYFKWGPIVAAATSIIFCIYTLQKISKKATQLKRSKNK